MTAAFGLGQILGPIVAGYVAQLFAALSASLIIASVLLALSAFALSGRPARTLRQGSSSG